MFKGTGLAASQLLAVSFITRLSPHWCFDQPLQGPQTPARRFYFHRNHPVNSHVAQCSLAAPTSQVWDHSHYLVSAVDHFCQCHPSASTCGVCTLRGAEGKQRSTFKSTENMWIMCVAHFFLSNSITPEWNSQSTPKSFARERVRHKWAEPYFCRWEKKRDNQQDIGRGKWGHKELLRTCWSSQGFPICLCLLYLPV